MNIGLYISSAVDNKDVIRKHSFQLLEIFNLVHTQYSY